jgi:ribonuclease R
MALPSKQQILDWVAEHPDAAAKRDIAKAFAVKGAEKIELKRLLKELAEEGRLERRRKSFRDAETLPPVTVVEVLPPDAQGDLFVRPLELHGDGPQPRILFHPREADGAMGAGDRFLARLTAAPGEDHDYIARMIRRIGEAKHKIVGIFRKNTEGGRIMPIDKGSDREWRVREGDMCEPPAPS